MTSTATAIFTGGTGRSGTTVLGSLLGQHSRIWATLPREIRFLTDRFGLLDLAIGGTPQSKLPRPLLQKIFLKKLSGEWWHRVGPDGSERGLHRGILESEFNEAVTAFRQRDLNVMGRSQRLVHQMMDPAAKRNDAHVWVDTSPANAMNANRILALLPDAFVIHVVRDGRDACASVVSKAWGPKDHMSALEWWRHRMLLSQRGMTAASAERTSTLVLENLLTHSRDEQYKDLLRFLGVDDEEPMNTFFNENMTAERGHLGRWKTEVPTSIRADFAARYHEIWQELDEEGVPLAPLG